MDYDDDNGDMASPQSDASFWDFEQGESRITQVDNSEESDGESSGESSGYECMVVPYNCFYSMTNVSHQLTLVTPLTKKTLVPTYYRVLLSTLFYSDRPQHLAHALQHPSRFNEALVRLAAKFHRLAASSSTTSLTKPLLSLTGRPRLLHSTVHARY
jgi:hypothetical protein